MVFAQSPLTIEKTTNYDLIARLLSQSLALRVPPTPAMLSGTPHATFFLARWEGTPAGCVCTQKYDFYVSACKYLFVLDEFRRRGIATELVRASVRHASEVLSTPCILATTQMTNMGSLAVMGVNGFRPIARVRSPLSPNILVILFRSEHEVPPAEAGTEEMLLEV